MKVEQRREKTRKKKNQHTTVSLHRRSISILMRMEFFISLNIFFFSFVSSLRLRFAQRKKKQNRNNKWCFCSRTFCFLISFLFLLDAIRLRLCIAIEMMMMLHVKMMAMLVDCLRIQRMWDTFRSKTVTFSMSHCFGCMQIVFGFCFEWIATGVCRSTYISCNWADDSIFSIRSNPSRINIYQYLLICLRRTPLCVKTIRKKSKVPNHIELELFTRTIAIYWIDWVSHKNLLARRGALDLMLYIRSGCNIALDVLHVFFCCCFSFSFVCLRLFYAK